MSDETAVGTSVPGTESAGGGSVGELVSAERAAVDSGDFEAFDAAHTATRRGEAPEKVERPAANPADSDEIHAGEDAPVPAGKGVSKRQQAINDLHRKIAEQDAELVRLRTAPRQEERPRQEAAKDETAGDGQPKAETVKERTARYLAMPGAPKVDDFDSITDFYAAQAVHVQEKYTEERAAVETRQRAEGDRINRLIQRDQRFGDSLRAEAEKDPTFKDSLSEEAKNLGGVDYARRMGVQPGPVNIVGELMYESPHAAAFLRHISANPTALGKLVAVPAHIAAMPQQWRTRAHIDHIVTEFRRLEGRLGYLSSLDPDAGRGAGDGDEPSTISSASEPPPTLRRPGRSVDPSRSALERDDFEAFDQQETARKIRRRKGA